MTATIQTPNCTIIVVGPPTDAVGGMASVVGQMLDLDLDNRFRIELFPNTQRQHEHESHGRRVIRHILHMYRLQNRIRQTGASIVHIHTCSGFSFYRSVLDMCVARRRGCRVVLHIHGAKFDEFYDREPAWRRRLIGWALAHADRVIALSTHWCDQLIAMSPRARIVVIENAVETSGIVSKSSWPERPCRFVLLARMDAWKGIDDLLDACVGLRETQNATEVILAGPTGTAGDEDVLNEKIRARGLDSFVRYVGELRGEAKANLLAGADAYVQPSHHEGMPIALLEALAWGLPVVATRVGAVPEVIEDGKHGLLVLPHRPDLLGNAMLDLAVDTALRSNMSKAARSLATARFGLDRFGRDLSALYDSLHAKPGADREGKVFPGVPVGKRGLTDASVAHQV